MDHIQTLAAMARSNHLSEHERDVLREVVGDLLTYGAVTEIAHRHGSIDPECIARVSSEMSEVAPTIMLRSALELT